MALTHNLDIGWSQSAATPTNTRVSISADGEDNRELSIADGVTNGQVVFHVDVSQLALFHIVSDKAVTVKTNSSGAPQETLTLTANVPLVWYTGCGYTKPFAGDVTTIYITNASGSTATIKINKLEDTTL